MNDADLRVLALQLAHTENFSADRVIADAEVYLTWLRSEPGPSTDPTGLVDNEG